MLDATQGGNAGGPRMWGCTHYKQPPQEHSQCSRSEGWEDQEWNFSGRRPGHRQRAEGLGQVSRKEPQAIMTGISHDQTREPENAGS